MWERTWLLFLRNVIMIKHQPAIADNSKRAFYIKYPNRGKVRQFILRTKKEHPEAKILVDGLNRVLYFFANCPIRVNGVNEIKRLPREEVLPPGMLWNNGNGWELMP